MMIAVYTRYGSLEIEQHATLSGALSALRVASDEGELFQIGVYDPDAETIYVPDMEGWPLAQEDRIRRIREATGVFKGPLHVMTYPSEE